MDEYIRDLIRREKQRADTVAYQRLQSELSHAFSAPDSSYETLSAAEVINRNKR